jgi:hypothetical protein
MGWLASFAFIDMLMLIAANSAWSYVGSLSLWQQMIIPIGGCLAGLAFVRLVSAEMSTIVEIGLASYASVALTSLIGGNVVYWLWVAPGLVRRLHRAGALETRWQDPASTPGVTMIAEGLGLSALFLLAVF